VALSIAGFREIEEVAEEERREGMARHAGPVTQKSLAGLGREGGVRMDVSASLFPVVCRGLRSGVMREC